MRHVAIYWNLIVCSIFMRLANWVRIRAEPALTLGYAAYDVTSDDK